MHLVSSRKSSERVSSASLRGPARTVVQTGGFTHSTRLRVSTPSRSFRGFTIVELLVVIVIIAILAAITILAYGGVTQKAVASSLQSDLSNAATAIKAFEVDNGNYPSTISTNCSTTPDSPTNKCLKLTPGNIYIGYSANNTPSSKSFLLIASNKATTGSGSIAYKVTNSTAPTQLATTSQPGTTPGAVLELHAAKANGGTSQGLNDPLTTTWTNTGTLGSSANGTLTGFSGTPWSADGLAFESVNGRIVRCGAAVGYSTWTVDGWVVASGSPTTYRMLFSHGQYLYDGFYVSRYTNRDLLLMFNRENGTEAAYLGAGLNWGSGQPTYFSATFDIGNLAYTARINDAVYAGTLTNAPVPATASRVRYVGNNNGSNVLDASVQSIRYYPFALTADQISANFAAGPTW